jgi:hypothetical protein
LYFDGKSSGWGSDRAMRSHRIVILLTLAIERSLDRQVVKMKKRYLSVVQLHPNTIRECPSHPMQVVPQHHEQPYLYENKY